LAVIRITVQTQASAPVVVIDGWLAEGDLDELTRTRRRVSEGAALRLGGLESCDAAGLRFLQDWLQAGAVLETASPFLRAVLTGQSSERAPQESPAVAVSVPNLLTTMNPTDTCLALLLTGTAFSLPAQPLDSLAPPAYHQPFTLAPASAETGGGGQSGTEQLARLAQNPIAKLISVPFQNNFNFGVGENEVCQWVMNFQPVIPITLNEDWNLITRTILPVINQPSPAPGIPHAWGLGDLNPSLFFSPAKPGKLIWGVGPAFSFPTATDSLLGNGKWCAGPAVVALMMEGQWVFGALANNVWSFAGWGSQEVNAMLVQPFINYNLPHGWYLTTAPIITANWEADSDNRWTVPIGGGVGKILHLGRLPVNTQLSAYYNVETPKDMGADWQLRFRFQFMFPK
jgi:hypothetical protein